jgi:hypothetical protein
MYICCGYFVKLFFYLNLYSRSLFLLHSEVGCASFASKSKRKSVSQVFWSESEKINFFASFRFQIFASNESEQKGHIFSLWFASVSFIFASYFPFSTLSFEANKTNFFASYSPFSLLSEKIPMFFTFNFSVPLPSEK